MKWNLRFHVYVVSFVFGRVVLRLLRGFAWRSLHLFPTAVAVTAARHGFCRFNVQHKGRDLFGEYICAFLSFPFHLFGATYSRLCGFILFFSVVEMS